MLILGSNLRKKKNSFGRSVFYLHLLFMALFFLLQLENANYSKERFFFVVFVSKLNCSFIKSTDLTLYKKKKKNPDGWMKKLGFNNLFRISLNFCKYKENFQWRKSMLFLFFNSSSSSFAGFVGKTSLGRPSRRSLGEKRLEQISRSLG